MNIGLGLPVDDPGQLLSWARRADAGPFSTLGLLDRLVHDNPEPLVTLAALAGATRRIRVQSEVVLAPVHSTALLAKQTATLDLLSGGRFTLGIGIGMREEDYLATGVDFHRRGRRLDEQIEVLRRVWAGGSYGEGVGPIGPVPVTPGGPEVLFGGFTPAAIARAARWGDGFLGAAPSPDFTDRLFRLAEQAWRDAGRPTGPRLVAQVNVAIGPDEVVAEARANVARYYAFLGDASHFADSVLGTPKEIQAAVGVFTDLGADEVILYCWSPDPEQIDRIADTLF
ncbi:LLM class flavin-dependent oxidoreductase [Streptomyces sp. NPDC006733]|uniref:LLM class flavin-dependent oxidoreductase n=1 Tax=Streptomyces sp. NPDC006733 TaxID=3155460 RepID=UPI00340A25C5